MQPSSPKREFFRGIRAELPVLAAALPFGMICGALAAAADIPFLQAQSLSAILFGGAAQLIVIQLFQSNTPFLVIIMTVTVVNLRHMLYSASLAPFFYRVHWRWKCLLAYLLTDGAYAVTIANCQAAYSTSDLSAAGEAQRSSTGLYCHWFYLGAGVAMWFVWQLSATVGILLGDIIPASWSLDFALALTFIALVAPSIKDRPRLAAALSAGITGVVAFSLPYKIGLVLAAFIGIATGTVLETLTLRTADIIQESQDL